MYGKSIFRKLFRKYIFFTFIVFSTSKCFVIIFCKNSINWTYRFGLIFRPLRLITSASISSFVGDLGSLIAGSATTTGTGAAAFTTTGSTTAGTSFTFFAVFFGLTIGSSMISSVAAAGGSSTVTGVSSRVVSCVSSWESGASSGSSSAMAGGNYSQLGVK